VRKEGEKGEQTHLVELQRVEQVVQLAVLGRLLEADNVLLKTVESQLLLVIDVDLEGLRGKGSVSDRRWR
jgi:hypothetical protein